jgi:RNA recognition motif-containing protein
VSALPRFQLRLYSSVEEPDRTHEAASELTPEAETSEPVYEEAVASEPVSEEVVASDAAPAHVKAVRAGDAESAARSIYLGNIYFDITEEQVRELAAQYGGVESLRLMKDVRGFSRG